MRFRFVTKCAKPVKIEVAQADGRLGVVDGGVVPVAKRI